jgi:hypothetical protein
MSKGLHRSSQTIFVDTNMEVRRRVNKCKQESEKLIFSKRKIYRPFTLPKVGTCDEIYAI